MQGKLPVTGEFPSQRASNGENASIWWRHHVILTAQYKIMFQIFLSYPMFHKKCRSLCPGFNILIQCRHIKTLRIFSIIHTLGTAWLTYELDVESILCSSAVVVVLYAPHPTVFTYLYNILTTILFSKSCFSYSSSPQNQGGKLTNISKLMQLKLFSISK